MTQKNTNSKKFQRLKEERDEKMRSATCFLDDLTPQNKKAGLTGPCRKTHPSTHSLHPDFVENPESVEIQNEFESDEEYEDTGFYKQKINNAINEINVKLTE